MASKLNVEILGKISFGINIRHVANNVAYDNIVDLIYFNTFFISFHILGGKVDCQLTTRDSAKF